MAMKVALVLTVLCSGFPYFAFALNRLRVFDGPNGRNVFNLSSLECDKKNSSLVTLYDEDDAKFINKLWPDDTSIWLGLIKKTRKNVTTWSDGVPVTFKQVDVNVKNGEQTCGAIENNMWKNFTCSERKPFMCYKDKNYTLIEHETKNWCQALQYCRRYFTDLVSISNKIQNQLVIKEGKNTSFWIGLQHDEWEWVDGGCSTLRDWQREVSPDENCTTYLTNLYPYRCDSVSKGLCSKGSVRIKVINERLTWEQAFEYCKANHTGQLRIEDEEDQKAVEKWLNYTEVDGPFWIGLRQSRVLGFWIWSDKTVVYSHWKNGKQPELPLSNHCGVIDKNGNWSDENCWRPLPFLCEEEISFMKK